jgi:CheY-like chemotaxis protein
MKRTPADFVVMRNSTINIAGLSFLLADPNPHSSAILHSILRGFGATRLIDARNTRIAIDVLIDQKVDMMLCEPALPSEGGLALIRSIRQNPANPCSTMPVLVVTGDTRTSMIKAARESGANMVIAKPMSPATLFDRLTWVAFNPRRYVQVRPLASGAPQAGDQDSGGATAEAGLAAPGPALSQNEIDNLLKAAQHGDCK